MTLLDPRASLFAPTTPPSNVHQDHTSAAQPWSSGLEDVVVASTALSDVDGEAGRLTIAGRSLDEIAADANVDFVDIAAVLDARARNDQVDESFRDRFAVARSRAFEAALALPVQGDPMAHLAGTVATLATLGAADDRRSAIDDDPAALVGVVHGVVAAAHRRMTGRARSTAPDAQSSAGAWLAAASADVDIDGEGAAAGAALDRYLMTVVDHGMNASTFAARVAASTRTSLRLCLVAGIATLAGPLHGGAPGPVLDLFDAVDTRGIGVLAAELAAGRRLMGFGHRVYRTRDPRAAVLEQACRTLGSAQASGVSHRQRRRLSLATAIEAEAIRLLRDAHPERELAANVEFFTALLLDSVGLDRTAFSLLFAAGRSAGWAAHALEQRRVGKLIRPRSTMALSHAPDMRR